MSKKVSVGFGLGLLLVLTGCGRSGPLLEPGANSGLGVANVHRGDTVTIGSMFSCLDKSGSVTVTDISPVGDTGLKVTAWAVRPNPYWRRPPAGPNGQIGVAREALSEFQFPTSHQVDAQCGKDGEGFEFAVQLQKTTGGKAGASGWVVTYTSDGDTKRQRFPHSVWLCTNGNEPCQSKI